MFAREIIGHEYFALTALALAEPGDAPPAVLVLSENRQPPEASPCQINVYAHSNPPRSLTHYHSRHVALGCAHFASLKPDARLSAPVLRRTTGNHLPVVN